MAANFSKLFIYAGYEMNQKYIASTLCENRAKPWLHCNGKCFLMKKIKQAEEKEKSEERQTGKNLFREAIANQPIKITFNTLLISVLYTPYPYFILPQKASTIFHPPQV